MKKFLFASFLIMSLLLLFFIVRNYNFAADVPQSQHTMYKNRSETVSDDQYIEIDIPEVPSETNDTTQPLDLNTLNGFKDPSLSDLENAGNCYEVEVDIDELEHINIPPEEISDNNTVTLLACEE